jgi:hypothetical protein
LALGSRQGQKHAKPDLTDDIDELMGSLAHHDVYVVRNGRRFADDDTSIADDVVMTGYNLLTFGSSSPLRQFNCTLNTLQARRQVQPLIGPGSEHSEHPQNLPPFDIADNRDGQFIADNGQSISKTVFVNQC